MSRKKSPNYYIENLTVDSWIFYILPHFLKGGIGRLQAARQIYYFNNSGLGLFLAQLTLWFIGVRLKRVDFKQGNARDRDGNLVWLKAVEDALFIQDDIRNNSEFQRVTKNCGAENSVYLFLSKWSMCCDLANEDVWLLLKLIFFVRIVECREELDGSIGGREQDVLFFMQRRPWFVEIEKFVEARGINIIPTGSLQFHIKAFLLRFDGLKCFAKELCKKAAYYWMVIQYRAKELVTAKRANNVKGPEDVIKNEADDSKELEPCVAVEHYGYLNLDSPELFSDLLFFLGTALSARDILIYFGLPKAPVTDKNLDEIKRRGMSAVATNLQATVTPNIPIFNHKKRKFKMCWPDGREEDKKNIFTREWLHRHISNYYQRYDYWVDFIKQHNVKIHVTWYKYSSDHCAILDAVKSAGGVGVVHQRSFDHFPSPWSFTTADVVFGFSKLGAHIGRDRHSRIPYYVIVGYLGDHRFSLLKKQANDVRSRLQSFGAKRVVAYFDEHASNDSRWDLAYQTTLEDYSYLLNKVLEEPWFGLILKPKVPATLRSRFKSVSDLLQRAEETGRCFVFEDTSLQALYPPAVASLGADIAIHGHLFAATAGVESALAGVPTLLLDYEGVPDSPLYKLEEGCVIFKDIDRLWKTCVEHWNSQGGIPGLGDWSDMLDELDPFRDGRAAERMEIYLGWLMEGFKVGLSRETVLADAAQRYGKMWGKDKILSVNCSDGSKNFSESCLI